MANRWYVVLDSDELGPLSDTGLERLIQGGRVDRDTMVRNEASGEWMSVAIAEELLAARPSRERPGDAAIQAARQAKTSIQRPPAPPAKTSLPPNSPPPLPPASAPSAGAAPSAHASTQNGSPVSLPPEPVASPAAGRSPLVWIGAAAGAVLILVVSFAVGWFALRGSASSGPSSPPPNAAPGVSPDVAALQQQAEQLKRELEEAKQKLENPPPAAAPPPSEKSPAEMPPAKSDAPPAETAATSDPGPSAEDLAAERQSVAEMIAFDKAVTDELARLKPLIESNAQDDTLNFESKSDVAYEQFLPQAEREVANLDAGALKARRQELERERKTRLDESGKYLAATKEAIEKAEPRKAICCAAAYGWMILPEDREAANRLVADLPKADAYRVYASLNKLTEAQVQQIMADQRLPDGWPESVQDPLVADAVCTFAVRLAPLNLGSRQMLPFLQQALDARAANDFHKRRKLHFLLGASDLVKEQKFTAEEVKKLIDLYGTFSLEGLPMVDAAITGKIADLMADENANFIVRVATGEANVETFQKHYDQCRNLAGDAWYACDQTNPFAGLWKSGSKWQLRIDLEHDAIAWSKTSPKAEFEQRVLKLGPDYLVAYEKRPADARPDAKDPFFKETFHSFDQLPGADTPPDDDTIAITYYALGKNKSLQLHRRLFRASFLDEFAPSAVWEYFSKPVDFRPWRDEFRRVAEKTQP